MNKIFLLVSKILNERLDDMGDCWGGHCTESEECVECIDDECNEKTVQENLKPSKELLEFLKK